MKLLPLLIRNCAPPSAEVISMRSCSIWRGSLVELGHEFWRSHEGALVNSGYRSADAILDRIRTARSDDEVRAAVAELERLMHEDPPAAFLAWQSTSRAVSTKFDVAAEEDRDILNNLWMGPAGAAKGVA